MKINLKVSQEFCSIVKNSENNLFARLQKLNARFYTSDEYDMHTVTIVCDDTAMSQAQKIIRNYLVKIYCVDFKREFLKNNLDFVKIEDENFRVLIETLVAFERESDIGSVKRQLQLVNDFSIDGFYRFRLKNLVAKWEEVVQITKENSVLLGDAVSFNLLLRFLLSTVAPKHDKVQIKECENGYMIFAGKDKSLKVFDENELLLKLVDIAPIEISFDERVKNSELFCRLSDIFEVVERNGIYGFS